MDKINFQVVLSIFFLSIFRQVEVLFLSICEIDTAYRDSS